MAAFLKWVSIKAVHLFGSTDRLLREYHTDIRFLIKPASWKIKIVAANDQRQGALFLQQKYKRLETGKAEE